eukprot:6027051-Pleurochrysis_carterae.AAC.1
MRPNEAPEESGGAGPSHSPEGHELEDRDEAGAESESGQTEATDNDLANLARNVHDGTAAPMRPITPITEPTGESGWHVRLCQTPEIGGPLPAETRELRVAVARNPRYDQDTIFLTFAMRFLPGGEYVAEYAASADNYYSTPPSIYHSSRVLWIEIWKDDHRGVIPSQRAGSEPPRCTAHGGHLPPSEEQQLLNSCAGYTARRIQAVEPRCAGVSGAAPYGGRGRRLIRRPAGRCNIFDHPAARDTPSGSSR